MMKLFLAGVMLLPLLAMPPEAEAKRKNKSGASGELRHKRNRGGRFKEMPIGGERCNLCQKGRPPFYYEEVIPMNKKFNF